MSCLLWMRKWVDGFLRYALTRNSYAILKQCILDHLKHKTRIFVTHQLQYLKYSNQVIVMDRGKIVEHGTYDELMAKENGYLKLLIEENIVAEDHVHEAHIQQETKQKIEVQIHQEELHGDGKLMQDEERMTGSAVLSVIWRYTMKMGGPLVTLLLLVLFIVAQLGIIGVDWYDN